MLKTYMFHCMEIILPFENDNSTLGVWKKKRKKRKFPCRLPRILVLGEWSSRICIFNQSLGKFFHTLL